MSDLTVTMDKAAVEAEADGYEVVYGDEYHLLLDFDTPYESEPVQYHMLLPTVALCFGAEESERWRSKSGNLHVVVQLGTALDAAARVALQAALGSDPKREILATSRILSGIEEPSMLFKPNKEGGEKQ